MNNDRITKKTQLEEFEDMDIDEALTYLKANSPNVDVTIDTTGRIHGLLADAEKEADARKKGKKIDQSYIGHEVDEGSDNLELADEDISDTDNCNETDYDDSEDYSIRIKKGKENIQINYDGIGINEAGDAISEWD